MLLLRLLLVLVTACCSCGAIKLERNSGKGRAPVPISLAETEVRNSRNLIRSLLTVGSTLAALSSSSAKCACSASPSSDTGCVICGRSLSNMLAPRVASVYASEGPDWYNQDNQRIFDTLHKSFVPAHPEVYLSRDLADKKVVAIGEVHSNPMHHKVELDIIRTLSALKSPKNVAVGLECFYRQHQGALDRFIFSHQDIALLKKETKWDETWGYDLNYYAKIFKFAAQQQIRLIGLNVPVQIAHYVGTEGYDQLPENIKALLPTIDLTVASHKDYFMTSIGGGSHGNPESLQRMYEAQTLWDEYMAESAVNYIKDNPKSTLVLIAGLGHIIGRVSIPDRIEKRVRGTSPFVIVPQQVEWSKENGLPIVLEPLSHQECDWAWYTEREIGSA